MANISARTDFDRRPVIYAGRFVDQAGTDLHDDWIVLDEQDVVPQKLAVALD